MATKHSNDISVDPRDEIDDCLSDSITVADLLADGSDEADPIDPETVRHACNMIGLRLRRIKKLMSAGDAS